MEPRQQPSMLALDEPHDTERILRKPEVLRTLGVSATTLQRWIDEGTFPPPVLPGGPQSRTVGWLKSDVDNYFCFAGAQTFSGEIPAGTGCLKAHLSLLLSYSRGAALIFLSFVKNAPNTRTHWQAPHSEC